MVQLTSSAERAFAIQLDALEKRDIASARAIAGELDVNRPIDAIASGTLEQALLPLCSAFLTRAALFSALAWREDASAWDELRRQSAYTALGCCVAWPTRYGGAQALFSLILDSIVRGREDRVRGALENVASRFRSRMNKKWMAASDLELASWLGNRYVGEDVVPVDLTQLGPYAHVVESWEQGHDEATYARVLEQHLLAMGVRPTDADSFTGSFAMVPLELEAIRVVREREGRSVPRVDHPFLRTPFARYPGEAGEFDARSDARFRAVVERAAREGHAAEALYDI